MADVYLLIHFCVVEVFGPLLFCLVPALQSAKMYMLQYFFYCLLCFGEGRVQYEKGKSISRYFFYLFSCLRTSNGLTLDIFRLRRNCMRSCSQEKQKRLVLFLLFCLSNVEIGNVTILPCVNLKNKRF